MATACCCHLVWPHHVSRACAAAIPCVHWRVRPNTCVQRTQRVAVHPAPPPSSSKRQVLALLAVSCQSLAAIAAVWVRVALLFAVSVVWCAAWRPSVVGTGRIFGGFARDCCDDLPGVGGAAAHWKSVGKSCGAHAAWACAQQRARCTADCAHSAGSARLGRAPLVHWAGSGAPLVVTAWRHGLRVLCLYPFAP
jgi:hypothetical protein